MRTLIMLMTIRRENLRRERLRATPFFGLLGSRIFVSSIAVAFSMGSLGCSTTSKPSTAESSLANQAEHKRYEERLQKMDARFPVGDKIGR